MPPPDSVFVRAALASRLVTDTQLEEALNSVTRLSDGSVATAVSDNLLGQMLVDQQLLNPWQVEQLRQGRTKFNLGSYQVFDAIGKGGMGHLFKARHELLGRVEAIKVLPRHKTTPDSITAFLHEIRTQAQLDHPNLVRITYADQDGDTYFFVTEFVPGSDLRRLVRSVGPLAHGAAALVVKQAAAGLEHAHRRGLVHRDVKPGNILVTPDGMTKVIDLGLAWFLEADIPEAQELDRLKIVGTADYLAPETIHHPDRVMPVSDVYALGCTLYYAVTGKVPFPGGNPLEKMRRHQKEAPLAAQQLNPSLPLEFVAAIENMMHKDPAKRIHSADAVVELLDNWIDATAPGELAEAVAKVESQRKAPRTGVKAVAPLNRVDETLIYGEEEEAEIRAATVMAKNETPATDDQPTHTGSGESQVIETVEEEEREPVDPLDRAVTFSIWTAAVVIAALIGGIIYEVMN